MATLTETLYALERVLSQVAPDAANRLQSGLARAEIDQCITSFSWQLPQDAYDLYQWHNGLSGKPGKLNLAEKFLRLKGKWHGELSGRENELHLKLNVGEASPLENRLVIAKFLPLDYALAGHRHLKLGQCSLDLLPIFIANEGKNTFYGMMRLDEKPSFYFANGTGVAPLRVTKEYLSKQIRYSNLIPLILFLTQCCHQALQPVSQDGQTESADYELNAKVLNQIYHESIRGI